jgi:D-alanyl-D-alanine carboxypeptidase/D-alanyl-D-alanine-endopeptidase (penicillin-binding protein 4)
MPWAAHGAADAAPADPWDPIINSSSGSVPLLFGVEIEGPIPYSHDASVSFVPASNTKLFTTSAALSTWGADHQFETDLKWQRIQAQNPGAITHLTLVGSGDPSWGLDNLEEDARTRIDAMVRELKSGGVTEVHGAISVIPNDPRWQNLTYPTGWDLPGDAVTCDGALAQAFNILSNCATYTVSASSTGEWTGQWQDADIPVGVTLNIQSGPTTALTVNPVFEDPDKISLAAEGFVISGTWATGAAPQVFWLPVNDAAGWAKNLLIRSLAENGITWIAAEPPAGAPGSWQQIASWSPTLSEILKPFLKNSVNLVGDAFAKILGQERGSPTQADLLSAGVGVVTRSLPPDVAAGVSFQDGSGMSHENRATPDAVLALLKDLAARADFPSLWDALPIAGVDGTLADRMKGTPAENVLRGKTGTLDGAYNLSGYVPRFDSSGRLVEYVPFVILTSTTVDGAAAAIHAEDEIGVELAELLLGTPGGPPRP